MVVVGAQWGDEGKGKIIDLFSSHADYVVRYQGGANAGHTLNASGRQTILHLIPSGILHPQVQCIISSGVVLDVFSLIDEIENLKKAGFLKNKQQLLISHSSSMLFDHHKYLDQAREEKAGSQKIGTTGRGVGPAYEERLSRKALLFRDLFLSAAELKDKLIKASEEALFLLKHYYKKDYSIHPLLEKLKQARDILAPYQCPNTSLLIHQALQEGRKVLFEGAQGALLDIFQGTYPYVTSSSTTAGSALTGAGLGWSGIKKVLAVSKAYTTRVGGGPFPSECTPEEQLFLEEKGQERGATTQRKRRCGWLDLTALKYSIRLNGNSSLALTKLDVLSGLDTIKVCVGYEINGKRVSEYPVHFSQLSQCRALYKKFSGWEQNINSITSFEGLPENARRYIQFIEEELKIPIDIISVGPKREETIERSSLF